MREILDALNKQEIDVSNDANSAHKNGSVDEGTFSATGRIADLKTIEKADRVVSKVLGELIFNIGFWCDEFVKAKKAKDQNKIKAFEKVMDIFYKNVSTCDSKNQRATVKYEKYFD